MAGMLCNHPKMKMPFDCRSKAGDENRTHMTSLEGWGFTIKLRPQLNRGFPKKELRDGGVWFRRATCFGSFIAESVQLCQEV